MAYPELCNKPFFVFTMPLYLAFRSRWPDLEMESQEFGPWVQNSSFSFGELHQEKMHSLGAIAICRKSPMDREERWNWFR
jgi:hypothetical protein